MNEPNPGPWQRPPPRRPASRALWLIVAAGIVGALTVFLIVSFPEALSGSNEKGALIQRLMLLAFIGASAVLHWRSRPKQALRNAALWAGIFAVLLLGYSLWDQVKAQLLPHKAVVENGDVSLRARRDGHFVAEVTVEGVDIRFLVDTGASDVVLSPTDAERLGFDLKALSFTKPYNTANGTGYGAPVRLGRMVIGPIVVEDVRASVNGAAMGNSLLGMSFLNRLSGYEVSGDKLRLRR